MNISSIIFSLLLGSMIFFVSIVTPAAFKSLNEKSASKFLRTVFPRIFNFGFLLAIIGSIFLYLENLQFYLILSVSIAFAFLFNNFVLTPLINTNRDKMLDGNDNSKRVFNILHTFSVLIYIAQIIGLVILLFLDYYYN